jgi:molecular chaperone GrpE (heat shock protein)
VEALRSAAPPSWAAEVQETLVKLARVQAKQGARLEGLEGKVEAGFAELRAAGSRAAATEASAPADDLLDALDLLETAIATIAVPPEGRSVAEGLRGVAIRLERYLNDAGYTRLSPAGLPVDGRHFRVVGEVQVPGLPDGVIGQVVRAAVLRGDQRIREGEVLITRREHG